MIQDVRPPRLRPDGLQLEEHRENQERLWSIERWAWGVFLAITLAAALGATGAGGIFAHGVTEAQGGRIEHPRVGRWQTGDDIVFHFPAGAAERRLTLGPSFAQAYQIVDLQPAPRQVEAGPDGEVMHFRLDRGGPARVVLHVRALYPGLLRWNVRIDGGAPVALTALILP